MPRIPILVHRDFVPNAVRVGHLNRRATDLARARKQRLSSIVRGALVLILLGSLTVVVMRIAPIDINWLTHFAR